MIEKTLKKTLKYEGNILRVREDEIETSTGHFSKRDVIEHPGGVAIALQDTDGTYFVVKQYRYAQGKVMIEFPAGKLEIGEDPLEAGKRELVEEIGYSGKNYEYLGTLVPTPSYCQEKIYMYTAQVDQYVGQNLDTDEELIVEKWSLEKIVDAIMNQEIDDSKTIVMALMIKNEKG